MSHNLEHILFELRRKAGHQDFITEESINVIRQIVASLNITLVAVQQQARASPYFAGSTGVRRNFCPNPSFEHDLTSWTESITATGSTARTSTQNDSGNQSLSLVMTDSTASGEIVSRNLTITGLGASEVWSISVAIRPSEFTTAKFVLRLEFLDSSDVVQATHNVEHTSTGTVFVTIDNDNRTSPATTTKLRISLILEATDANATSTVHCDSALIERASTSGSYFDGDSQDSFWETTIHAGESIEDTDGDAIICGYWKAS